MVVVMAAGRSEADGLKVAGRSDTDGQGSLWLELRWSFVTTGWCEVVRTAADKTDLERRQDRHDEQQEHRGHIPQFSPVRVRVEHHRMGREGHTLAALWGRRLAPIRGALLVFEGPGVVGLGFVG